MPNPSVTVILPYYNREDVLAEAVGSVLNQSFSNLELLLIDDGSTDGSRRVATSFEDGRITHVFSDSNHGVCAARNQGLKRARTSLIAFMDSDDFWLPTKLEVQISAIRELQAAGVNVAVMGCGWRHMGASFPAKAFSEGPFGPADVFLNKASGTGTPMLLVDRKRASSDARFDPSFPSLEERDYTLSCLGNGTSLWVVPEVLAEVRRGRTDHVANPLGAALAWRRFLEKYDHELQSLPGAWSYYHFRAAREFMVLRKPWAARSHFREAVSEFGTCRSLHLFLGAIAGRKGLAVAAKICEAS